MISDDDDTLGNEYLLQAKRNLQLSRSNPQFLSNLHAPLQNNNEEQYQSLISAASGKLTTEDLKRQLNDEQVLRKQKEQARKELEEEKQREREQETESNSPEHDANNEGTQEEVEEENLIAQDRADTAVAQQNVNEPTEDQETENQSSLRKAEAETSIAIEELKEITTQLKQIGEIYQENATKQAKQLEQIESMLNALIKHSKKEKEKEEESETIVYNPRLKPRPLVSSFPSTSAALKQYQQESKQESEFIAATQASRLKTSAKALQNAASAAKKRREDLVAMNSENNARKSKSVQSKRILYEFEFDEGDEPQNDETQVVNE
jgi:hypothetical protein